MAKVSPVRSNSESENEEGASGKRNAKTLKAKDVGGSDVDEDMEAKDVEEDTGDGEGEDGSEGEEEEYEIEAILDAKRGTFPEVWHLLILVHASKGTDHSDSRDALGTS